jgi:copper resistance protein B
MKAILLGAASLVATSLVAAPVLAQGMDHSMHNMPGMKMPAKPTAKLAAKPATTRKAAPRRRPARRAAKSRPVRAAPARAGEAAPGVAAAPRAAAPAADPHAGHDMSAMPGIDAESMPAGHDMSAMPAGHDMAAMGDTGAAKAGTDLAPGNAPAPAPQPNHLADRFWGADAMAVSRKDDLRRMHGGMTYYQVLVNIAEYQVRDGRDGYRWDGEAWIGGDSNRLTIKSEGEVDRGGSLGSGEVQALYSRALDPYWNLQAGVRYDFKPDPSRTYATIGVEGLAPYWFDVEGALFVSNKGDVLARAEAWYDQRVTQFVVLQPRVEANFAMQDVPETGTGSGLSNLELGLRLRYDKSRRFGPYVGVSWERQFGDTARFTRVRGDDTGGLSFVTGLRVWF